MIYNVNNLNRQQQCMRFVNLVNEKKYLNLFMILSEHILVLKLDAQS